MQRRIVQLGAKKEPRRKVGPIGVAPETGGCNQTFYSKCGKGEGNGAAAKPRRNFLSGLTACAPEQGASEKGEIGARSRADAIEARGRARRKREPAFYTPSVM